LFIVVLMTFDMTECEREGFQLGDHACDQVINIIIISNGLVWEDDRSCYVVFDAFDHAFAVAVCCDRDGIGGHRSQKQLVIMVEEHQCHKYAKGF